MGDQFSSLKQSFTAGWLLFKKTQNKTKKKDLTPNMAKSDQNMMEFFLRV
jgi:hypothetical protein